MRLKLSFRISLIHLTFISPMHLKLLCMSELWSFNMILALAQIVTKQSDSNSNSAKWIRSMSSNNWLCVVAIVSIPHCAKSHVGNRIYRGMEYAKCSNSYHFAYVIHQKVTRTKQKDDFIRLKISGMFLY
jgi:hypothetical protein